MAIHFPKKENIVIVNLDISASVTKNKSQKKCHMQNKNFGSFQLLIESFASKVIWIPEIISIQLNQPKSKGKNYIYIYFLKVTKVQSQNMKWTKEPKVK